MRSKQQGMRWVGPLQVPIVDAHTAFAFNNILLTHQPNVDHPSLSGVHVLTRFLGRARSRCKNKLASISVPTFMSCLSPGQIFSTKGYYVFNRFVFALKDTWLSASTPQVLLHYKEIKLIAAELSTRVNDCMTWTHCTDSHYVHRLSCRLGGPEGETRCLHCSTTSALFWCPANSHSPSFPLVSLQRFPGRTGRRGSPIASPTKLYY